MDTNSLPDYKYTPLYVRFWRHVKKTDTCWLWTGATSDSGHGVLNCKSRTHRAHRVSMMLHFGPVPDDAMVCHTCDVPNCVNPDHLYLGTALTNSRDCWSRGRGDRVKRPRGERHGNAKINADIVRDIRRLRAEGVLLREIADKHDISTQTAWRIAQRTAWKHVD